MRVARAAPRRRAAAARGAQSASRFRGPACELLLAGPRNAQLRRNARVSRAGARTRGQLTSVPSAAGSFSAGGTAAASPAARERSTRLCLSQRQRRCCTPARGARPSARQTSFYGGLRSCARRRRERRATGGDGVAPESYATNTAVRAPTAFPARRAAPPPLAHPCFPPQPQPPLNLPMARTKQTARCVRVAPRARAPRRL